MNFCGRIFIALIIVSILLAVSIAVIISMYVKYKKDLKSRNISKKLELSKCKQILG